MSALKVFETLNKNGWKLATAESCTGGMVAAAITDIAGSSEVFDRGFVTYSNDAKTEMLGVSPGLLAEHGAVSEQVARAMAEGALKFSNADIAISITGIAGPGGGSTIKPVGLVYFGCATRNGQTVHCVEQYGDLGRSRVRTAALNRSLDFLLQVIETKT